MKPEQAEILWKEQFEILKTITDQKENDAARLEQIHQTVRSFEEKLAGMKVTALPTDLSEVTQTIEAGFEKIKTILSAQPKSIVREFHFHLFPKTNIKEYYQTYSSLAFYLGIFLLEIGLTIFGVKWIEGYNRRQEELQQFQLNEKNKLSRVQDDQHIPKQKPNKKIEFHGGNYSSKKLLKDSVKHIPQEGITNYIDTQRK